MLTDGLYKVDFMTPLGSGSGVVMLNQGSVKGGDSSMYYDGTYQLDGDKFTASMNIATHTNTPGMGSVFGVANAQIDLSGIANATGANVTGSSPQAPGLNFQAKLSHLC